MRNHNYDDNYYNVDSYETTNSTSLTLMNRVYIWLTGALALSAVSAYLVLRDEQLLARCQEGLFALILIELGLVIGISWMIDKMSASVAGALFGVYSVFSGITLGVLVSYYAYSAIIPALSATAGTFIATSVYGYITKKDLSSVGSFCFMGLIGIIIASLINFFLRSPALYWITTYLTIFIFIGLTAWDTQKIKQLSQEYDIDSEARQKLAVLGALTLYLDFVNIFIAFLRIFGGSRD